MNVLKFVLLESTEDNELEILKDNYSKPSVERFVEINKERFWSYVTETENVYFYKVYNENTLSGTVQCEIYDRILYLAIVVFPEYQNKGIGTDIIKFVLDGRMGLDFKEIQISIDEKNTASMKLFKNSGFIETGKDGELIDLQYIM